MPQMISRMRLFNGGAQRSRDTLDNGCASNQGSPANPPHLREFEKPRV